MYSPES